VDQATGLQNNLNRWYDAVTGRWLSEDPIGLGGGDANLYRYCGNGPMNGVDPSGMQVNNSAGPTPVAAPSGGDPGYMGIGLMGDQIKKWQNPPPPVPTATQQSNSKAILEGYLITYFSNSKDSRLKTIPNVANPKTSPLTNTTGPTGGNYKIYGSSSPPVAVGGGGSATCILLVVKVAATPPLVAVFHFSLGGNGSGHDAPYTTLEQFSWPNGSTAIVAGGDNSPQSNTLADEVIGAANWAGLHVVGVSPNSMAGVDQNGNWFQYGK